MRPVLAFPLCLALLQAFLLAPVQHVHETEGPGGQHEHAALIHAHFSAHAAAPVKGRAFDDIDEHPVWQLDTFTLVLPAGVAPAIPSAAPETLFAPEAAAGMTAPVEERAHDPPARAPAIPRAPPA